MIRQHFSTMITHDYNKKKIDQSSDNLDDLKAIASVVISKKQLKCHNSLIIFPNSFYSEATKESSKKEICTIMEEIDGAKLCTNSIVGFVGHNQTYLSIYSRFQSKKEEDYFLHYMLQKIARINLFNLQHTTDEDHVFNFLIYLFPTFLKRAINQGIYRQYVTRKYNDANIRGIVDFNRHIRYNLPFNGKVAYVTREYSYDNSVTQLIRHTIEFIRQYNDNKILSIDVDTQQAVKQIINATSSYTISARQSVINQNLRPIMHPYYTEYTALQKICLQILRFKKLKYSHKKNEIYGILIDAAWLWEEYLAILLKGKYEHYKKEEGKRFYLFDEGEKRTNIQQIIPDYLSPDRKIVADAKYIPLDERNSYAEEKATAIYYKTITYMYRFHSQKGLLLYPCLGQGEPICLKIKTEKKNIYRGTISKIGLEIPTGKSFEDFCAQMSKNEQKFIRLVGKEELKLS